jgi:cytosine/adenosine deaminase-related metal-dependent hydrolase
MKKALKRLSALAEAFDAEDDPRESHFDPVHLGAVLVVSLVAIGALYWLLWTLLVYEGVGPFAEALRARGIEVVAQKCSPVAYLVKLGVIKPGTLCIHCVQVDEADIELIRATHATVAHCPLSNRAHGHGILPIRLFRKAGVPLGLGTDSVISVGELDLWAEAEAAGCVREMAMRALTIDGARALGWAREIGSLDVGKAADLAVFPCAALRRPVPPSVALLTVVSGRIVHQISVP